jgi:hypothetical protein
MIIALPILLGVGFGIGSAVAIASDCVCECHGDPDCNGEVGILDVVRTVGVAFRNEPAMTEPDCPYELTDVNCDGGTDVMDVVAVANVAFRNGNRQEEYRDPCSPSGQLTGSSECKTFPASFAKSDVGPDQDCLEWQYDGASLLALRHVNAGFNCCPRLLLAQIVIQGADIGIDESEDLTGAGCFCLCLYDLDYEIANLPPGVYSITVNEPYAPEGGEVLEFTLDLVNSPVGSYCIQRDTYPWGTQ